MSKKKIQYFLFIFIAVAIFIPVFVIAWTFSDALYYTSNSGELRPAKGIDAIKYIIKNDSGLDYFVPNKTNFEWSSFKGNLPDGVTLIKACSASTVCGESCFYRDSALESVIYRTIALGNQCWFADDLGTRYFANGSAISQWNYGADGNSFKNRFSCTGTSNTCTGEALFYQPTAAIPEGFLASDSSAQGNQGLCPSGWRVPSVADILVLQAAVPDCTSIGGNNYVFNQLCLNNVNFNVYGFGADLKGFRSANTGSSYGSGQSSHYLLSNRFSSAGKWVYSVMTVGASTLNNPSSDYQGYSIRCIKNIQGVPGQN